MPIGCAHVPRFAVEVERQRRQDLATRLILIGEADVFDCSLGAEASGVKRTTRMSEALPPLHVRGVAAEPFFIARGELQRRDGTVNALAAGADVAPKAHNFG